jgi:hypothetical protein
MRPPLYARALLLAIAGELEAECVAGDLEEEFPQVCEARGRGAGNRWYAWQVIRSVLPLLVLRIRSGELTQMVLGAALAVALPLLLLDRLWCFVYSQIPLRDGTDRAPGFLAVNVVLVCLFAAMGGGRTTSRASAAGSAAMAAMAAAFAVWASASAAPAVYVVMAVMAAPAGTLASLAWRRWR